MLFSEEVTPESVQDRLAPEEIAAFSMPGNRAAGVALQPGRRVAYVAMRDPIGPFVPVQLTIEGATDRRGQSMGSQTKPVLVTVTDEGGVVTGRVLNADGTGAPFADVRLFYEFECEAGLTEGGGQKMVAIGIAAKNADAEGRYGWDYVLKAAKRVRIVALDPANPDDFRPVRFAVSRHGQRLEVNIVFLGRGTLRGRTLAEDGTTLLPGTQIRVTSLTDQSQSGVVADEQGAFEIGRIPVGSILVEAVDTTRPASIFVAEDIPFAGAIVTRDLVLLDVDTTGVVVKYGALTGRVLRRDGLTPVTDVPVIASYASRSQTGVRCPPPPGGHNEPPECAVAVVRSDASGAFAFPRVVAGTLRVYSFDQGALAEGEVRIGLPADGSFDFNLLVGGGLGKVHGVVVDRDGRPVTDARVGGGLTLTAVDAQGRFTLVDVPVGRREIVAVSDAMQSTGSAFVDLVREGEEVNVTIVMESIGGVAGIVSRHDGRPAAGITVYALQECYDAQGNAQICVAGQAVTDATGAYRIDKLLVGRYSLSAFAANMSDGNVADVAVRYHRQVVKADIRFRGGGGRDRRHRLRRRWRHAAESAGGHLRRPARHRGRPRRRALRVRPELRGRRHRLHDRALPVRRRVGGPVHRARGGPVQSRPRHRAGHDARGGRRRRARVAPAAHEPRHRHGLPARRRDEGAGRRPRHLQVRRGHRHLHRGRVRHRHVPDDPAGRPGDVRGDRWPGPVPAVAGQCRGRSRSPPRIR